MKEILILDFIVNTRFCSKIPPILVLVENPKNQSSENNEE